MHRNRPVFRMEKFLCSAFSARLLLIFAVLSICRWDRCFMSLECVIVWWASTLCSFSLEIARKIW